MSDIPPNAMEMGKFLIDYNTQKKFKKLGSRADLDISRQVNQEYLQALNSTFLEASAKGIQFLYLAPSFPELFEPADAEYMLENNGELDNEEGENVEATPNNRNRTIVKIIDEENFRVIHPGNWTPKAAHIFRKLEFKGSWIVKLKNDDLPLYQIVTQLAPYITTLKLNTLPLDSEIPGIKYSEFLNEFTNLKYLEIDIIVLELYRIHYVQGMSIDELEIGIANLKLKPKITFYAKENHREILAKFGHVENVSFNFDFKMYRLEDNPIMETIAEIQNNSTLGQIKYNFTVCREILPNFNQVKAFTELCVKPQMKNQIEKLDIFFNFDEEGFAEEDHLGIVNCLAQLSPNITYLFVRLRSKPTWDILNHDLLWPKLNNLWIIGYNYPLEILKTCTNLQFMQLEMDEDVCIFHNHDQTEKESLKEYFGNLPHLEGIYFVHEIGDKVADGNELDKYLKEILPQLGFIRYFDAHYPAGGEDVVEEDGSGNDSDDNEDL